MPGLPACLGSSGWGLGRSWQIWCLSWVETPQLPGQPPVSAPLHPQGHSALTFGLTVYTHGTTWRDNCEPDGYKLYSQAPECDFSKILGLSGPQFSRKRN